MNYILTTVYPRSCSMEINVEVFDCRKEITGFLLKRSFEQGEISEILLGDVFVCDDGDGWLKVTTIFDTGAVEIIQGETYRVEL